MRQMRTVPGRHPPDAQNPHRHHRGEPLAVVEIHQVHDVLAAPGRAHVGNLVDLQPVNFAAVGEDQQVAVRGGHKHALDEVLGLVVDGGLGAELFTRAALLVAARRGDHVGAAVEDLQDRRGRRQARGEGEAGGPALQVGDRPLEGEAGGVPVNVPELPVHTATFPPDVGAAGTALIVTTNCVRLADLQFVTVFLAPA